MRVFAAEADIADREGRLLRTGGECSAFSTVLMLAVPAAIAGCRE